MNREQIEQQRAGREMDKLIYHEVLGNPQPWPGYSVDSRAIGNYSTDIAAAWQVVEHLEAQGWGHKHNTLSAAAEQPGTQWTFRRGAQVHGAEALTPALAICRSAYLTTL